MGRLDPTSSCAGRPVSEETGPTARSPQVMLVHTVLPLAYQRDAGTMLGSEDSLTRVHFSVNLHLKINCNGVFTLYTYTV